ncbi:hypothetical protein LSTR_LSTR008950 [Laodelphax striatellus]|uniref:pyridoxal 5'-phosphate synthase n=1 Tax=Laodelphax striatellus TaxID=195883 RepID=A0A482WJW5_LAOST|nr:hypothetical protein LSTR_LSTR008950 [Laodelphax striatellus]
MKLVSNVITALGGAKSLRRLSSALPKTDNVKPTEKESTGLHQIQTNYKSPFLLFKDWYKDHEIPDNQIASKALTLSTANKQGQVSSRTLILRRLDEDGMVIMTDNRSRKAKDLNENPYASMVYLWVTMQDNQILARQVRVEGDVVQLPTDNMAEIFEIEPLFCKIRAHICHQGKTVDWNQMKDHHDKLHEQVENNNLQLEKPDHVVAYKIFPYTMEFYESLGQTIADRLLYVKNGNEWEIKRLAA